MLVKVLRQSVLWWESVHEWKCLVMLIAKISFMKWNVQTIKYCTSVFVIFRKSRRQTNKQTNRQTDRQTDYVDFLLARTVVLLIAYS